MQQAPWLESDTDFEGIGAHPTNPRYDHVDDVDGQFEAIIKANFHDLSTTEQQQFPGLLRRESLIASVTVSIRLDGPDVSHYQYDYGEINWATVLGIPTFWAATKLTQSIKYLDPTAAKSRARMKQKYRGLYHWVSSTTNPEDQAAWFAANVGTLAKGEFLMLDCEEAGVTVDMVLRVARALEKIYGRPVAIYTGAYVAGGTIWQSTAVRNSAYGPRPMILAAYTNEAHAKDVCKYGSYPWHSWQYSSNGPVAGIVGRCDMNRVDDTSVYDRACGLDTADPTPTPTPTPTPDPNPTPTPPPAPGRARLALLGSITMWTIIGIKEWKDGTQGDSNKRFAWNGVWKIDLDAEGAADFINANITPADGKAGHDLTNPYWMPLGQAGRYQTVAIGLFPS